LDSCRANLESYTHYFKESLAIFAIEVGADVEQKGKDVFYVVAMDLFDGTLPLLYENIL
jgi:hypothetical protein